MKFYQLVFVGLFYILCVQIVRCVSALELTAAKANQIEYPDIIIETILHNLGTNQIHPVNVTQINTRLGYSQQTVQAAASILKNQHTHHVIEKIFDLRSKIDVAFDTIGQNMILLESSLDRSVCIADFGVFDVRNALQLIIDVCSSSNYEKELDLNVTIFSSETISSSTHCLSSAIQTLLTSAKTFTTTNKIVDKNVVSGVQAIVESVLSVIEIVLRALNEMKGLRRIFEHQHLIQLSSAIGKFKSQPLQISNFEENSALLPFTAIASATKTKMEHLPLVTDSNIAILLKYILVPRQEIPTFNSTVAPIKALQSHLWTLSNSIHSIYATDDLTGNTVDTSSQNLISTIAYLTNSVGTLPSELIYIREFHEAIEPNLRADLLLISSNVRTLSDEITLIVERRLIDLICRSSSVDKANLQKLTKELKTSVDSIILTFEQVVRSVIETVRNNLYSVFTILNGYVNAHGYDDDAQILFADTQQLIADLDRILSKKMSTISSTKENAFTVCSRAFEEVAESPSKLRAFLRKSVGQIERYLL